ncbi:hypothetical protein [Aliamphritea spongicola]|nr:hypothetical protein [Aliamphritea spongicola]
MSQAELTAAHSAASFEEDRNVHSGLTPEEMRQSKRNQRRRKLIATAFVVPLIVFVLIAFIAPIGTMLYRSVYHPTVAQLIPETLQELQSWDERQQHSGHSHPECFRQRTALSGQRTPLRQTGRRN